LLLPQLLDAVPGVRDHGPRIAFVAFDGGGAGRIRSFYPANALAARGWDVGVTTRDAYPQPGDHDVVIVHRPLPMHEPQRARLRDAGALVIVQEDDDLRSIPPTFLPQHIPTAELLAAHEEAIANADGLIVSTPRLLDVYGPLQPGRTWLVRNWLPEWIRLRANPFHDGRVRCGWQGIVATHRHDLEWLAPVASRALAGTMLSLVGDPMAGAILRHQPLECFRYQPQDFVLYSLMGRVDVGLVPLAPIALNVAKSWLKQLEYAMLGIPSVVVDLPEQRELAERTGAALVSGSIEAFADDVQRLVRDGDLRSRLADSARRASTELTLERNVTEWEHAIEEAL
jgi:O-antigen biosynthesis protein